MSSLLTGEILKKSTKNRNYTYTELSIRTTIHSSLGEKRSVEFYVGLGFLNFRYIIAVMFTPLMMMIAAMIAIVSSVYGSPVVLCVL